MAACSYVSSLVKRGHSGQRKLAGKERTGRILEAAELLVVVIPGTALLMLCLWQPMDTFVSEGKMLIIIKIELVYDYS